MSAFRTKVLTILGSVVGVSGCSGETDEADLREGLESVDWCEEDLYGYPGFSYVSDLNPVQSYDFYEFRTGYFDEGVNETFEEFKAETLADPTLSDEAKEEALTAEFETMTYVNQRRGECTLADGCDRYLLPESPGEFFGWEGPQYLFATGANGPAFVGTKAEALAFLGEIDTPHEAAWIAFAERYDIPCSGRMVLETKDGYELYVTRGNTCGGDVTGFRVSVSRDGTLEVIDSAVVREGDPNCVIGRLPGGRVTGGCVSSGVGRAEVHPVGRYFAENARLEAASVVAFLELADDLEAHGAPSDLVLWARRAAQEETRHARLCAGLARRYGADVGRVHVTQGARRTLLEIACENAAEGLTREAYGALVAHHQAMLAADASVRRVMRSIARDEAKHAEFSIALHRWITTRLTPEEAEHVASVRAKSRLDFRQMAAHSFGAEVEALAGLPSPERATRLFDALLSSDIAA